MLTSWFCLSHVRVRYVHLTPTNHYSNKVYQAKSDSSFILSFANAQYQQMLDLLLGKKLYLLMSGDFIWMHTAEIEYSL